MSNRVHGPDLKKRKLHDGANKGHRDWNDRRGLQHNKDALVFGKTEIEHFPTPKWMNAEEKEVFEELRATVLTHNIAKQTDSHALQMLAIRYSEYIKLCKVVAKEGYLVEFETNSGVLQTKANPLITARDRAFQDSKSLLVEFGLTPSSRRSVLKADAEKADNTEEREWDDILN